MYLVMEAGLSYALDDLLVAAEGHDYQFTVDIIMLEYKIIGLRLLSLDRARGRLI